MSTSDCVKRVQGDLEPDLPIRVMLRDPSLCPSVFARDLTELTVRAMMYNKYLIEEDPCTGRQLVDPENALFHRILPKREVDLLGTTSVTAPASPVQFDPVAQPASAQRISVVISGFAVGGTITLTGTDAEAAALTEDVVVTADGTVFTTAAFASLDLIDTDEGTAGIEVDAGTFDFRLFVHDGLADLVWLDGDLDVPGDYLLRVELLDTSGELETACDTICLMVKEKIKRPIPIIEGLATVPASVGAALTVTGQHFLDLVETKLTEVDTGTETTLAIDPAGPPLPTSLTFLTDVLPVLPGGNYTIIPVGADDEGTPFAFILLPIITDFSPTTADPLDTITIDGDGFTGATGADLILISDGTVTAMTGFVFVNDDQVTADVPAAQPAGDYVVRVTGASNPSNRLGVLTIQ
jgi:hypothetical protein